MSFSPPPPLAFDTVEISTDAALIDLLPDSMDATDVTAFLRADEGLIGWGRRALTYTVNGINRFAAISTWWNAVLALSRIDDPLKLPGTGPVLFTSFAFDPKSAVSSAAIVPENVVGRHGGRTWFTKARRVAERCKVPDISRLAADIEKSDPAVAGAVDGSAAPHPSPPSWKLLAVSEGALGADAFTEAVVTVRGAIARGRVSKVVVARDLKLTADSPIHPAELLKRLERQEKNAWIFCIDGLIGASPEMLLRQRNDRAWSRVLAGSRPAGDTAATESMLADNFLLREHGFSVRSVEEAFAGVGAMPHATAPFLLTLSTVHHIATDVTALLESHGTPLRTLAALHPSAAVCGTPRSAALHFIRRIETASGMDRGRFSGPVGWTDSYGNADWCIALRCGILGPEQTSITLYAGCGIVDGANPAVELRESTAKFNSMLGALGATGSKLF